MKLSIAIAVLMLVFAAHTEAQEEQTLEEKFANFGSQVTELTKDLAEKTKTTFDQIHTSEFATNTRNWFSEQFEKVKAKLDEIKQ
ncbi:apolipoprotein C-I [Aplochiton taeniatus]